MRIIITGATGVAGLAIYRAALIDPAIQKVTLLTRRPIPSWAQLPDNAEEKTETIVHQDFKSYPPELARRLAEHDGLVWALGRSSVGMSEEAYTEMSYGYPMAAARALKDAGAGSPERPFRFEYLSGSLADPKSSQMWARVKARVEKDLPELLEGMNMKAHIFRPGYFFPLKKYPEERKNQRSAALRAFDMAITPIYSKFVPTLYAPLEELGPFALEVAKGRWPDRGLLTNADMRELVKELPSFSS
ncbi:hypothetical protein FKP32DRAFT_1759089 [Trametes sanguinea]|nr:hypothetical protein FKP32DRAFT_1759089 [Trametes sanguinea]